MHSASAHQFQLERDTLSPARSGSSRSGCGRQDQGDGEDPRMETMMVVIRSYQVGRRAGLPQWEIDLQVMAAFFARHCERPYVDPAARAGLSPVT
jgi:hypothetical protein